MCIRDSIHIVGKVRPAAQINGDGGQRLVHGQDEEAVAADSLLGAQRLVKSLPQADADILYSVVAVDLEVALGVDFQVEKTMLGEQGEHVIEETDAGVDAGLAGAVDVKPDVYV